MTTPLKTRVLLLCTIAAIAAAVFFGVDARRWQQRAERAEQQIAAAPVTTSAAAPDAGRRTFTASNGVVLGPADMARIDAEGREMDKAVAEFEYSTSKLFPRPSKARGAKP